MDTKELYEGLLEITLPWEINRIEIDKAEKEVHVYVKYGNGQGIRCPECGKESPRYDKREERVWRHQVWDYPLKYTLSSKQRKK
jgi:hypothetical protein